MRNLQSLRPLWFLLALACSGNSSEDTGAQTDAGEQPIDMGEMAQDLGTTPPDLGMIDMGPPDCSTNPNQCAPMQQLDASCNCLPSCDDGLMWNPISGTCETPPAGECAVDSDCPGPDDACLDAPMMGGIGPCMGADSCQCFTSCDPYVRLPQSGCSPGEACTWLGNPPDIMVEAICLPEGQGGLQGDSCMDNPDCSRNQNFFCTGGTDTSTGACARLCNVNSSGLCESFGDFSCANLNDPNLPDLGLCRSTPPLITDLGNACTQGTECESGLCSQVLQNTCSAPCGGVQACPGGSVCITFNGDMLPPGEGTICISECPTADAAGDAFCQARSPNLVCRDILAMGPPLCMPGCTVIGCGTMGQTCDQTTGRCN